MHQLVVLVEHTISGGPSRLQLNQSGATMIDTNSSDDSSDDWIPPSERARERLWSDKARVERGQS